MASLHIESDDGSRKALCVSVLLASFAWRQVKSSFAADLIWLSAVLLFPIMCSSSKFVHVRLCLTESVPVFSKDRGLTLRLDIFALVAYMYYAYIILVVPAVGHAFIKTPGFMSQIYGYDALFDYYNFPTAAGVLQILPITCIYSHTVWIVFISMQGFCLY